MTDHVTRTDVGSVLIVDDDPEVRKVLRLLLEPGHRVVAAESGEGALEVLRRERFDVVTLDLRMPGLDGIGTLRLIRKHAPGVEVMIITGDPSFQSAIEGLRLHAVDYLVKPFAAEEVLAVVQRAVAARRAREREAPPRGEGASDEESIADLVERIESLGAATPQPRAARLKLDYLQLLAYALRDCMPPGPEKILASLFEELGRLADEHPTLDPGEVGRVRSLVERALEDVEGRV